MKHHTTNFLLVFLASLMGTAIFMPSGSAEDRQLNAQCPSISVVCPDACPKTNENIVFRANVQGGEPSITRKFNWSVSSGRIISGPSGKRVVEVAAYSA